LARPVVAIRASTGAYGSGVRWEYYARRSPRDMCLLSRRTPGNGSAFRRLGARLGDEPLRIRRGEPPELHDGVTRGAQPREQSATRPPPIANQRNRLALRRMNEGEPQDRTTPAIQRFRTAVVDRGTHQDLAEDLTDTTHTTARPLGAAKRTSHTHGASIEHEECQTRPSRCVPSFLPCSHRVGRYDLGPRRRTERNVM